MPLEAVMFCVDTSEWMRNGDYVPTRADALRDAVQALANQKLRSNQESIVGLLSLAGHRVDVLHSPSRNMGQILTELKSLHPEGTCDLLAGLKIAQLSLKNRQNKVQRQRIILIVASPVTATADELVAAGKQLRKNNVAVDVVHFGTENVSNDNAEKLEALVAAVNNDNNSHILFVPAGVYRVSDAVMSSPIGNDGNAAPASRRGAYGSGAVGGSAGGGMDDDIDALMETDPELAMALRMSLEEANAPAAPAAAPAAAVSGPSAAAQAAKDAEATAALQNASLAMDDDEDEDAALAAAIALSMAEMAPPVAPEPAPAPAPGATTASTATDSAVAATPAPAAAPSAAPAAPTKAPATATDAPAAGGEGDVTDPAFLAALLGGVDGLNADEVGDVIKAIAMGDDDNAAAEAEKKKKKEEEAAKDKKQE